MENNNEQFDTEYYLKRKIDLKKDNQTILIVNIFCVFLMVFGAILGYLVIFKNFTSDELLSQIGWHNLLIIVIGLLSFPFLHEITHALVIQIFKKKTKMSFGFNGLFAYVGAEKKFNKIQYVIVALAPILLFSAIFITLMLLLPQKYFMSFYFLEILNIGSAAGDIYIATAVIGAGSNLLVCDDGLTTFIYQKKKAFDK